ncbi:MAG TPA: NAD(P)/FAD-dependent oxidoreductase, partial [Tepidiformaceae bacterium]|nr:NAD(P)/FAD-dependent oxidoreductase [Tepidiformaceae bacterium]
MPSARTTQPITASDASIQAALEDAFLPALLPALAQATGDYTILRDDLRPPGVAPGIPQGGMPAEQQAAARDVALAAIQQLRDKGPAGESLPLPEAVRRISAWMTGSAASDDYIPLLLEELAPEGEDPRAPGWRKPPETPFSVAIIGAGMSGILAAIRLKQAGVPFVILEKNADVGGTWLENTYPGARVDVSNAFYSYSFAQRTDWPKHYSTQDVLLDYFRDVAHEFGIREHVRFNTEVVEASWDEAGTSWRLRMRTPDGSEETLEAQAVISAVGQLNRPLMPEIQGMETFAGPSFHSARWDHSVNLRGKRVVVIGTGASAAQFIPAIAPEVADLTVFQRTPPWLVPVPHYHDDVPDGLRWLFGHIPHYVHWYRFWLFWNTTDGMLAAATVDEDWAPRDVSVSAANDQLRALLTGYLRTQFADRPDLLAKCLPKYPPAAKRLVLDNGTWAATLKRENVRVVSDGIREVTASGVVAGDGVEYPADVIIYGTGFQASKFLTPMRVTGRGGADLHAQWDGDARAYMGITVPQFPNLFLLYGPNTNIVVNGSIIYFSECEVRYVLGCIKLLLDEGKRALDCRQEVHDAYNERIDRANLQRVWGVSDVSSWYKNDKGRVAQNWPFNLIEYWRQTRAPDPGDYV